MQSATPAFPLTFRMDASMLPITMPPSTSVPVPSRLRYNVLLETLSEEEFAAVRDKFTERKFRPDEVIIEDEGYGDEVYFLVEGRVRISKTDPRSRQTSCSRSCIPAIVSVNWN